ncbi:helix-turn-helix transcriptional regulator [Tranquillimonas rosea]|uniref:helix-turn-helix transcriptional regulator n=1 Tax=Tranquillimonas rosea TaxID=641238 RepID=UPI003BA9FEB1
MELHRTLYEGCPGAERALRPGLFTDTHAFRFTGAPAWMKVQSVSFPGIGATAARVISSGHEIELTERERLTLLFPRSGALDIETSQGRRAAHGGQPILCAPEHRITRAGATPEAGYDALVLVVPPAALGDSDAQGAVLACERRAGAGDPLHSIGAYLRFLFDDLTGPRSLLTGPRAIATAERLLVDMLREAMPCGPDPSEGAGASDRMIVARAEDFLRHCDVSSARLSDVAEAAGVGLRRLQQAFRAVRRQTPREQLVALRLTLARRKLLDTAEPGSVTVIALDCGFAHLGRFAASYRATYGESPSATLRARIGRGLPRHLEPFPVFPSTPE